MRRPINPLEILLVDDDKEWAEDFCPNLTKVLPTRLAQMGWDSVEIRHATDQEDADKAIAEKAPDEYDLVLLDLWYPESAASPLEHEQQSQGMKWLPILRRLQPHAAIVIITGYPYEDQLMNVVNAIRDCQANDFIPKTAVLDETAGRISVALNHARHRKAFHMLEMELARVMTRRVARAFVEDVLSLIDLHRATLKQVARRIESGDPSAAAQAPVEIGTACLSLRSGFMGISDLFGLGREQATRMNVGEFVRNALTLYDARLEEIGATRKLTLEEGKLDITTYGDDLRTALCEVLNNAIYALRTAARPPGLRQLDCFLQPSHEGVVISISDNGNGFTQEAIDHMFEPGWSTHKDDHHRGLGLYIAKRMVQGFGGRIEPRNRPKGGAEVVLVVPNLVKP